VDVLWIVLLVLVATAVAGWFATARVVTQVERGVVFRLGRAQRELRRPGLTLLVPLVDRMTRVNVQVVTMPVPAQDGITRDNVTVRVDAVVYFKVIDPLRAVVEVQDYGFAIAQVAQTSLRSIIGKSELDELLSNREHLNQGLELMLDNPAASWGIEIDRVEIKDVALPEGMKRSMSRQAEAERERRSRIITADGEFQASQRLSEAAAAMADTPAALQLRLLQTMVEVAAEKNSTLVLPFPVEMLRYFEAVATGTPATPRGPEQVPEQGPDEAILTYPEANRARPEADPHPTSREPR
jgi:regulator of protease activity HflC (stomatin/prohibitin superfamily)